MAQTKVKEILNSEDTTSVKLGYLWDYYKWHTVIFILVLIFSGIMINDYINRPIAQFHVAVLSPDVSAEEEEALTQDLTEMLQPEGANDEVFVTFTSPGRQYERFVAQYSSGEYDIVLMDGDFYEQYSTSGSLQEFRLSGVDEQFYYQPEIYDNPIGVDSSQIPQFAQYETTSDLIMVIPENTQRPETVIEFFEDQGFVIDLIND